MKIKNLNIYKKVLSLGTACIILSSSMVSCVKEDKITKENEAKPDTLIANSMPLEMNNYHEDIYEVVLDEENINDSMIYQTYREKFTPEFCNGRTKIGNATLGEVYALLFAYMNKDYLTPETKERVLANYDNETVDYVFEAFKQLAFAHYETRTYINWKDCLVDKQLGAYLDNVQSIFLGNYDLKDQIASLKTIYNNYIYNDGEITMEKYGENIKCLLLNLLGYMDSKEYRKLKNDSLNICYNDLKSWNPYTNNKIK